MYRWVDHTAELELHVETEEPTQVFTDVLTAFAELVGDAVDGEGAVHELHLRAADRAALLAQWLEELVFLADTEGFVPQRAASLELDERELHARVEGVRGSPRPLVKAVTYHGLDFSEREGRWNARLVLDV